MGKLSHDCGWGRVSVIKFFAIYFRLDCNPAVVHPTRSTNVDRLAEHDVRGIVVSVVVLKTHCGCCEVFENSL